MTQVILDCLNCAETDSQHPTQTNTGSCDTGYYSSGPKVNNAWFHFEQITSYVPAGSTIDSAYLHVKQVSGGYNYTQQLDINLSSYQWASAPTWNSGNATIVSAAGTINTSLYGSGGGTRTFTITSLVQYASDNRGTSLHVFRIARDPNSTGGTNDAKRFSVTEANHTLEINYTSGSRLVIVTAKATASATAKVPTRVWGTTTSPHPYTAYPDAFTAEAGIGGADIAYYDNGVITYPYGPRVIATSRVAKTVSVTSRMTATARHTRSYVPNLGERDIDGFFIYMHQGDSDGVYTWGSDPTKETVYSVPYTERRIVIPGLPSDKYYHFRVAAYRHVDDDIDTTGLKVSALQPAPEDYTPVDMSHVAVYTGPFKPLSNYAPTDFTGLYGNDTNLGYIDQGVWKTYQDKYGHAYWVGEGGNSLSWDGTKLNISIDKIDYTPEEIEAGAVQGGLVLSGGSIRSADKLNYGDYAPGFWLGLDEDDVYKFYVGDGLNFMRWTGEGLEIRGTFKSDEFGSTTIDDIQGISIIATEGVAKGTAAAIDFYYVDTGIDFDPEADLVGSIYPYWSEFVGTRRLDILSDYKMLVRAEDEITISSTSIDLKATTGSVAIGNSLADYITIGPSDITFGLPIKPTGGISHVHARRTTNQSINNAQWTTVIFSTEVADTLSEYDDSTGIFTAQNAGYYTVSCNTLSDSAQWAYGSPSEYWMAAIITTDYTYYGTRTMSQYGTTNAWYNASSVNTVVYLDVGDTVKVQVYHNQGAAVNLFGSGEWNYFTVDRMIA